MFVLLNSHIVQVLWDWLLKKKKTGDLSSVEVE